MADPSVLASLEWRPGDIPASRAYGDVYYSAEDGLAETRHVFLDGNRLPERFAAARHFRIAELGFGTGLGFLAAWNCWRMQGGNGTLAFTSFEAAPLSRADMLRALSRFPGIADELSELLARWPFEGAIDLPGAWLELHVGDARRTLPLWDGTADAWFLDGFAPARNPELWEDALVRSVATHTAPGGTVATYTAAGAVRRALVDAGFEVCRRDGFSKKRHMLTAVLKT